MEDAYEVKARELDALVRRSFYSHDCVVKRLRETVARQRCELDHLRGLAEMLSGELESLRLESANLREGAAAEASERLYRLQIQEQDLAIRVAEVNRERAQVAAMRDVCTRREKVVQEREEHLGERERELMAKVEAFEAAQLPARQEVEANVLRTQRARLSADQLYQETVEAARLLSRRREELEWNSAMLLSTALLDLAETTARCSIERDAVHDLRDVVCAELRRRRDFWVCAGDPVFSTGGRQVAHGDFTRGDFTTDFHDESVVVHRPGSASRTTAPGNESAQWTGSIDVRAPRSAAAVKAVDAGPWEGGDPEASVSSTSSFDTSPLDRLRRVHRMVMMLNHSTAAAAEELSGSCEPLISEMTPHLSGFS